MAGPATTVSSVSVWQSTASPGQGPKARHLRPTPTTPPEPGVPAVSDGQGKRCVMRHWSRAPGSCANTDFRHGLADRGPAYALPVKGKMTAHAETAEPPNGPTSPAPRPLVHDHTRPLPSTHGMARMARQVPAEEPLMPIGPNQGSTSGGTTVTITGVNLSGATAVHFGSRTATITA
ncbi:IPT/TIG domain-containing protein [Streptomyces sp. NPDC050149]|uniref:IPT/TIG domain-containing protein n=1 Tax=Streptomyces sp. NPDC050149 TaxID=3365603 RepID=UPI0037958829